MKCTCLPAFWTGWRHISGQLSCLDQGNEVAWGRAPTTKTDQIVPFHVFIWHTSGVTVNDCWNYTYMYNSCMMWIFQTFLQSACNNIYGLFLYTLRLDVFTTFTMGLPRSIRITNTSPIWSSIKMTLGLMLSGTFLPRVKAKMLVLWWVFCSLQAVTTGHILTPTYLLYPWSLEFNTQKGCENIISEIWRCKSSWMLHCRERFAQGKTVAGSRDHHCFTPTEHAKEKNIGGEGWTWEWTCFCVYCLH